MTRRDRFSALRFGGFAAVALLLAALGICGVSPCGKTRLAAQARL